MMTSISRIDPRVWDELAAEPAAEGRVQRRILPSIRHDVHVAEARPERLRMLIMSIDDSPPAIPQRSVGAKGLRGVIETASHRVNITLSAASTAGNPLFAELAADLSSVLYKHRDQQPAGAVLRRLASWKAFYARQAEPLSKEQAAGLFSELEVLCEFLVPATGSGPAVAAWHGPDPSVHDFEFPQLALEVKSFRGSGVGRMTISSEDQLDAAAPGELFLAYVRLDQRSAGPGATLADQVAKARNLVSDSFEESELLEDRLLQAGWRPSAERLRTEVYMVKSTELFAVREGFPRITRDILPTGIGNVRYHVDRGVLDPFLVSGEQLRRVLTGENHES